MLIHRAILTLFILAHFVFPRLTMTLYYPVSCVFTHVASIYANLLEQKKAFTKEKSSTPTGLVWDTNMAAVSLFWDTNMATMTSSENAQSIKKRDSSSSDVNYKQKLKRFKLYEWF